MGGSSRVTWSVIAGLLVGIRDDRAVAITTLAERGELSRAARSFLRTEAGSAVLLLTAAVLALVWTNLFEGYEEFWHTGLTPALGALGGLAVPAGVYLLFNAGGPGAAAWGVPISTDTAVLLGVLALVGPRCPDQLRVFLLALAIVDDIGAVAAIAVFYTDDVQVTSLVISGALFAALLGLRFARFWRTPIYVLIGVLMWLAV